MKIAITSKGDNWNSHVDPRFGRTEFLFIYDESEDSVKTIDNRSVSETAHGAGPQTAQILIDNSVEILITGNGAGGNAGRVLSSAGIKSYTGAGSMTVKEAYNAYKEGRLSN